MSNQEWNDRHFIGGTAQRQGARFAAQAKNRSEQFKKETDKWKKGDFAKFSNGVIGKVTKVNKTSLEIRIGLGRSQKYSPKMVEKVNLKAKSQT